MFKKIALLSMTLLQLQAADYNHDAEQEAEEILTNEVPHLFSSEKPKKSISPSSEEMCIKPSEAPHLNCLFLTDLQRVHFPEVLKTIEPGKVKEHIASLSEHASQDISKRTKKKLQDRIGQMRMLLTHITDEGKTPPSLVPAILFDKKITEKTKETTVMRYDSHIRLLWISELLTQTDIPKLDKLLKLFYSVDFQVPLEYRTAIKQFYVQILQDTKKECINIARVNKELRKESKELDKQLNEIADETETLQKKYLNLKKERSEKLSERKTLRKQSQHQEKTIDQLKSISKRLDRWEENEEIEDPTYSFEDDDESCDESLDYWSDDEIIF